jgi:hypothetical protein
MALLWVQTSALEGVKGQRHAPASLLPGKTRYSLYRRLGGPQGQFGQVRKISPPPEFDPWTFQPAPCRYTDCATRPNFSLYFLFYFAFSLSLFYMEGCCINRRPLCCRDFEIMQDTVPSQLHTRRRIYRKPLCDPILLEPFPSLEPRRISQPFSPFLTRAGSSRYLNILYNLSFQYDSHICLHSRRFDMWLKKKDVTPEA